MFEVRLMTRGMNVLCLLSRCSFFADFEKCVPHGRPGKHDMRTETYKKIHDGSCFVNDARNDT